MFKINKNQMRLPLGGHHFYEKGLMIKGETFAEVVKKLTDFRLNNNVSVGDPEQDILTHYGLNFPWMVVDEEGEEDAEADQDYIDWCKWVLETWRKPPAKLITTKEATYRWDVCSKCPKNKNLDWPNNEETKALTRKAYMMRRGADVPKNINYCSCHRVELGVFTFIEAPIEFSRKLKDDAKPECCWV